jgi:succinate dehydrogenase/fumarate reductase cytochrome b subunit (b558 family)
MTAEETRRAEPPRSAPPRSSIDAAARRAVRLRRLHSASGAIALGVFLVEHVLTNASALAGAEAYDRWVGAIQRLRVLPFIEVVFILLPLAYHAGYGLLLVKRGNATTDAKRDVLYTLQRASAIVVLLFVLAHLWELRVQKWLFGLSADTFYTKLAEHLSWTAWGVPWIAFGYLIGIAASTFHFANGLVRAATTWNVSPARISQRRVVIASGALGIVLFIVGAATVIGLSTGSRLLSDGDEGKTGPCGSQVPSATVTPPRPPPSP